MVSFLKNYQFTFDFTSTYVPFKRRKDLRRKVVDNGGIISYILNKQVNYEVMFKFSQLCLIVFKEYK